MEALKQPVKCKKDCKYFSPVTKSCDYRLIVGVGRGCPAGECIRYEKGEKARQRAMKLYRG